MLNFDGLRRVNYSNKNEAAQLGSFQIFKYEDIKSVISLTCEREVSLEGIAGCGGHYDEGTLRWLVESIKGGYIITLVGSLLIPLIGQNL